MNIGSVIRAQLQLAQLGQVNQTSTSTATRQLLTAFNLSQLGQADPVSSSNATADLLAPVNTRLNQQLESTNVRLSVYGQIKSAFDGANSAATALSVGAGSPTASNSELITAAQSFVSAFNLAARTVGGAVDGNGGRPGALASDQRAKLAAYDLARALDSDGALADLEQAAITDDENGALILDSEDLEQALQTDPAQVKAALSRLGQLVSAATADETAGSGNVGRSIGTLTTQSQLLSAQQAVLDRQETAIQGILDQQSTVLSYSIANALAAYQSLLLR